MKFPRVWLAALAAVAMSGSARAADWTVAALDGGARGFSHGAWSPLRAGQTLQPDMLVQTDAALRLARGGDLFVLGADSEIKLEGGDETMARVFKGAFGATVEDALKPVLLMTTYAEIATEGAIVGVVVEPFGATIAVPRGQVRVTGLTTRDTQTVNAGEIFRVRAGEIGAPELAVGDEPAMAAADGAPGAAKPAPELARKPASTAIRVLDLVSTGAIRPVERGRQAEATEDRTDRRLRVGPFATAMDTDVRRIAADDAEAAPPPWDRRFQWSEVEGGEVRLKPLMQVIADLEPAQAATFWFVAFVIAIIWGAVTAEIHDGEEIGLLGDAALVALAMGAAVLLRDTFFRDFLGWEPYLTIGLVCGAPLLALHGGGFARQFVVAPRHARARTIHTAPASRTSPLETYSESDAPTAARTEATTSAG